MENIIVDSNILLDYPQCLSELNQYNILIPIEVIEELDNINHSDNESKKFKVRKALYAIEESKNVQILVEDYEYILPKYLNKNKPDNSLLGFCKDYNAKLITNDLNLRIKAFGLGIKFEKYKVDVKNYTGYKEIILDDNELADFYESKTNHYDLLDNEYLIIKDKRNEVIDAFRWSESSFKKVTPKKFNSDSFGKLKCKDIYQTCLIDSFFNNQITLVKGRAGTGKSLLSLSFAMSMIDTCKFSQLIVFANPVATLNSARLGFYPGDKNQKLLDSQTGNMLSSKFGDRFKVEDLIKKGKLVLLPFSDIRGFDTTNMNAIVYITEAQNLDIELMKLAIQRIGEDCKFIIDGDFCTQVDSKAFGGLNNGMRRTSEIFRGDESYGEIELPIIYRSRLAEIASRM